MDQTTSDAVNIVNTFADKYDTTRLDLDTLRASVRALLSKGEHPTDIVNALPLLRSSTQSALIACVGIVKSGNHRPSELRRRQPKPFVAGSLPNVTDTEREIGRAAIAWMKESLDRRTIHRRREPLTTDESDHTTTRLHELD